MGYRTPPPETVNEKKRKSGMMMTFISDAAEERAIHARKRVQEIIRLYREQLDTLQKKSQGKKAYDLYLAAATLLQRAGISMDKRKRLGSIPGVEIGDQFRSRAEMKVIGLHCQYMAGVDYNNGVAISIVASKRYSNLMLSSDVLIYSGHGGNPNVRTSVRGSIDDQKLERGNLALANSMEARNPVRVIRCLSSNRADCQDSVYVYDGLYTVESVRQERDEFGKLVFKFKLIRIPGQPPVDIAIPEKKTTKRLKREEILIKNDISEEKEGIAVSVVNGWDDERPSPFNYVNVGCCCKCENAVPIKFQFEVFRTQDDVKGWGLRSRQYISSGSLICEYVGEYKEVRKDGIRYRLDIGGVSGGKGCYSIIDATRYGNLGRFINQSNMNPNLKVEKVDCRGDGCRVPREMIYAAKDIPPRREMTLQMK